MEPAGDEVNHANSAAPARKVRPKRARRHKRPVKPDVTQDEAQNNATAETEMTEMCSSIGSSSSSDTTIEIPPVAEPAANSDAKEKWHWTARIPGQVMPTVVGPVGMSLCWRKLALVWEKKQLETVGLAIGGWTVAQMTILFVALAWRWMRYPGVSVKEFKHPTHFIFGIFGPLYLCLISSFVLHWSKITAEVFWYAGFGTMCIYMVFASVRLITVRIPVAQMHSFLLFGPLPILLAVQLAPYAPKDLLFFGWACGTLWYFALHVLLLFRWIHIGLPQKNERAAVWLVLAASADSVLAYAVASPNGFGEAAKAIFFLSNLQFVVLLALSHKILWPSGFVPTWWMTTLPMTAFSSSWLSYGLSISNRGVEIVGTILVGCSTFWILLLYLLSVIWILRKRFWPKSPWRPDVERVPLE